MILKAIEYTTIHHQGQYRKGSQKPYAMHPISAAMVLQRAGINNEHVIVAALLHDLLEDTEVSYDDLTDEFNEHVARLVASVSEEKYKCWEERKQHTIDMLKTCNLETKQITLADKYHNLYTVYEDMKVLGDEVWHRFSRPYDRQKWYYTSIYDALSQDVEIRRLNLFQSFGQLIEAVFNENEKN